jgi:HEPN domain-containing protein
VNRAQLQALAQTRLLDAEALLAAGRWAGAYYLTGYAVECGLKSCLLRHLDATGELFSDRKYLRDLADCWTHDLEALLKLAKLDKIFGIARGANPVLNKNWETAAAWTETSRYGDKTETEARELFEAVTHDPDGVLRWLKTYW